MTDPSLANPKYSSFNIYNTAYKTLPNGQTIPAYTFVPKNAPTDRKLPIMVRFHGGFLISGSAIFPDWTYPWMFEYLLVNNAIMVSADYRLLPESNGLEILSDIQDFWSWLRDSFPSYLATVNLSISADMGKIILHGASAGGYLAAQSALSLAPQGTLKAVIATYPMIDLADPWYSVASTTRSPFGTPQLPVSVLTEHLEKMVPGQAVTSATPPDRLALAIVAVQQGKFPSLLKSDDDSLFPLRVLEKLSGDEEVPFLFVFAGKEDSAVPYTETTVLAEKWEAKFGKGSVLAKIETGDHGLDAEATLETAWLKEGLNVVTKKWLE